MDVRLKRVYDDYARSDGRRVLVDGIWPRGVKKEQAHLDRWLKALAPSAELRKWFGHDPARWQEFRRRYRAELEAAGDEVGELRRLARERRLTLLYAARDREHNNAVVLKEYLEHRH